MIPYRVYLCRFKKKKAPWLNSAVVTLHQEGAIG